MNKKQNNMKIDLNAYSCPNGHLMVNYTRHRLFF